MFPARPQREVPRPEHLFNHLKTCCAAEQGPKIYRVSPPVPGAPLPGGELGVTVLSDTRGDGQTQGMAFIQGHLYLVRHGSHSKEDFRLDTLVRLKRLDDGESFGEPERLFEFPAVPGENVGWESDHGVHGIVPGPDGKSIYLIARTKGQALYGIHRLQALLGDRPTPDRGG